MANVRTLPVCRLGLVVGLITLSLPMAVAQPPTADRDGVVEVVYRRVDGHELKMDLYLPSADRDVPCVLFIHGGGWKNGDRESGKKNASWLTEHGFAVASIDYRLTDVARWPAQIDDCYAAVRWIRANGNRHGIDGSRVGVWGTSAGAHLAALVGTRPDPTSSKWSSRVQAVCDWFGPSELLTMPPNNVGDGRTEEDVANSNGAKLLGATVREVPSLAKDASALDQVTADDPPFLIVHGAEDTGVPLSQSQKLHASLVRHGVPSRLHVIDGAGHGGKQFRTPEVHAIVARFFARRLIPCWPQGPGVNANFQVRLGNPPAQWSVVENSNVRWRKTLPETGQSTVTVWGDRIFFTTMKPVTEHSLYGSDIVAWCCASDTGETIWKRELPGDYPLRLSGCFSDSSSPPPVTDGKLVCFFNASGRIGCFDFHGEPIWERELMPVGRTQPTLVDGNVVFIKQTYMPDEHGHFSHEHKNAPHAQWTQLQAIAMATGQDVWTSRCGSNMGCVPLPMTLSDGRRVFVVGRGGGHSPPEKPEGVSMIDADDGSTIWTVPLPKFMSTMSLHAVDDEVLVFDRGEHLWINAVTGQVARRKSFVDQIDVRVFEDGKWSTRKETLNLGKKTRAIIQQSNVVAGHYHYFRSYTQPWLGRVHLKTGKVEHLQLPVQIDVRSNEANQKLWHFRQMDEAAIAQWKKAAKKTSKVLPIQQWGFAPNDMKNSRGLTVVGDERSRGNGWGHHASQVPTVIGEHLYVPTMSGTVYVIRWDADRLDEDAIVAINDLGPVGQAWNRASLSYAGGRLYAHTIKEVVCLEQD